MEKRLLIITYAVQEELDATDVLMTANQCKKKWFDRRLGCLDRLKVRLDRRHYDKDVVLVETGIGKVNAYSELESILEGAYWYAGTKTRVSVLNVGTAASMNANIGDVVTCSRFIDRDLAKIGYGSIDDYTLYLDSRNAVVPSSRIAQTNEYPCRFSCNSGDTFVTNPEDAHQMRDGWTAVCDMEGFAQARAVEESGHLFNNPVEFRCIKYITDKIGEDNSLESWEEELPAARMCLTGVVKKAVEDFYSYK